MLRTHLPTCLAALALLSALHTRVAAEEPKPQKLFDGRTLTGWKPVDTNSYIDAGKVEVKDGVIALAQGSIATGIRYTGEFPKMNYEVSLEARRVDGSDFFCGMTFPVNDAHCTLIIGGWGGGTTGLSNVNGFNADENETTGFTEFEKGRWYKIRLRVTPEKISAWIDDKQIVDLDAKDKRFDIWWEQEPLRPFGIGNWYTASELKNITLTKLGEAKEK